MTKLLKVSVIEESPDIPVELGSYRNTETSQRAEQVGNVRIYLLLQKSINQFFIYIL